MAARTAKKAAVAAAEPEPPAEDQPAVSQPAEPVFVAAHRMMRNGKPIPLGTVIPDAHTWPRLESWIRAGYIKEA